MSKEEGQVTSENLAVLLMAQGQYDKAESLLTTLLQCRLNVFGDGNVATASAYQKLGYVLEKQGKYEQAVQLYECALNSYEADYGRGHPEADFVYASLTEIYRKTKQYDKALEKSMRQLEIRFETLGDAHPQSALSCHNVAICLYNLGRHAQALDMLNRALKVQQEAGDGDTHGIAAIYTTMAKILIEQKRFDKAMEIYERVLKHQVQVLGQQSPAVALTYRNMGLAYESQSNTVIAWKTCIKALAIQHTLIKDSNPNAAWRRQCEKNTGNIDVLHVEANTTMQIVQILEKKMAAAMRTSQETNKSTPPSGSIASFIEPQNEDVLFGRAQGHTKRQDNRYLHNLVENQLTDYHAATSMEEKSDLSETTRSPPSPPPPPTTTTGSIASFIEPKNEDVLFGRARSKRQGNRYLYQLVADLSPAYDAASSMEEKGRLSDIVVTKIMNSGGRFLKLDKDTLRWYEVERKEALKKVVNKFGKFRRRGPAKRTQQRMGMV
mmetsp:Transcript_8489/g.20423  ORF Transcript_8489/g.20423 Transcript_8489/m.20423 type:complete len:494 (+) Transcript_8489:295-1776(+)